MAGGIIFCFIIGGICGLLGLWSLIRKKYKKGVEKIKDEVQKMDIKI